MQRRTKTATDGTLGVFRALLNDPATTPQLHAALVKHINRIETFRNKLESSEIDAVKKRLRASERRRNSRALAKARMVDLHNPGGLPQIPKHSGINIEAIEKYVKYCHDHDVVDPNVLVEKHHVIMRALMPRLGKDKNNLVRLTPADHLRVHWILVQIFPDSLPVLRTFNLMVGARGPLSNTAGVYSESEIEAFAVAFQESKVKMYSDPEYIRRRAAGLAKGLQVLRERYLAKKTEALFQHIMNELRERTKFAGTGIELNSRFCGHVHAAYKKMCDSCWSLQSSPSVGESHGRS
jgi:hypothetical protein